MVPTGETMIPYFWVEDPDIEAVEEALLESTYVEEASIVDRVGDEALFRVVWAEDVNGIIETITETESVILEGNGHGDNWTFELRFPEYDALSRFYRSVVEKGISITLENVHNPIDQPGPQSNVLTDEQREALQTALKEGYFAVPREITLVELADQLGISDSAVSQRVRRGLTKLLTTNLAGE
jgi:predicted DNA binding protein